MDGDNELLAIFCLYSTPELKGQMSFSVVRHLSTFHIFTSSQEPLVKGIQVYLNEEAPLFFKGE